MRKLIISLLSTTLLACNLFAAPSPILSKRDAITDPEKIAGYDAGISGAYGDTVLQTLLAARTAEGQAFDETTTLKNLYKEGKLTPQGQNVIQWKYLPASGREDILTFISTKPTIDGGDVRAITELTRTSRFPALEARAADILAQVDDTTIFYYVLKYNRLTSASPTTTGVYSVMTNEELLKVTTGLLTALEYDTIRKELLLRLTSGVINQRRAQSLPISSSDITTAMQNIVNALNAPLWAGLQEATATLESPIILPNYASFNTVIGEKITSFETGKITSMRSFGGSCIFKLGTEGYALWTKDFQ
jgi:hypothetical protein